MPTYEYACTACAEHIEVVQSFTDASLTECPSCSGRLRKVFSPVGVVFKGSGFYKTDSRSSAATSKSDSKADAKQGTKSDAKSESKSESAPSGDSSSKSSDSGASSTSSAAGSTSTGSAAAAG